MTLGARTHASEVRTRIFKVTARRAPAWQAGIAALEEHARYPLGDDTFRLDHGSDYFAFFRRLGDVHYYAALAKGEPVAVGAGVLRRVPFRAGERPRRAWYLCDLKVRPDFRGGHLPLKMLGRAFLPCYLRCRRGYAITMNPPAGPNRVVRLLARFEWVPIRFARILEIYSFDAGAMERLRPLVERYRGPISFLSLRGKKDLVLDRAGAPLPLLHVQHGPCAEAGVRNPAPDHVHMLCAPAGDELSAALRASDVSPSATASIVESGMHHADWRFILTSDI